MPCFPVSYNKCPHFQTNKNGDIQKTVTKQLPLYYDITKAPNVIDPLIFGLSIVYVRSCKSKYITRNKDNLTMTANTAIKKQNNSDCLIPVTLTESVCNCKS